MNWVRAYADQLLQRHPLADHPYFSALLSGHMDKRRFINSQRQFLHAVKFFSQAMAALLARLADSGSRQVLIHNLAEEHGWDEERGGQFQPGLAHDHTFLRFLDCLQTQPDLARPPVQAFNLALLGACSSQSVPFAFASLGMIEYDFADISAVIGQSVVKQGWVPAEELVHYSLHAEIDKRHASEFFQQVDCAPRLEVEAGLEFGCHIFRQLYNCLSECS